jgi:O-acetyl-ADP-ribose deacetylase (regulator of RNase III)
MITELDSGDYFAGDPDYLVNTVNCVKIMGKGLAKEFKSRFPDMFLDYVEACSIGSVVPGKMYVWRPLFGPSIINFPTKRHWRDRSRLEDIESGLIDLARFAVGGVTMHVPALGCRNGGLQWSEVKPLIYQYLGSLDANIKLFTPNSFSV